MLATIQKALFAVSVVLVLLPESVAKGDSLRSVAFDTTEVTQANVSISPDGKVLIFSMVGHLFRVPVEGGEATQLTFGTSYNTDPAFSPHGSHVAFVSDRDGSEGNVFLLELSTGKIERLTSANWTGRPAWSPDGRKIAFLSFIRETHGVTQATHAMGFVSVIDIGGDRSHVATSEVSLLSSVFYLPNGQLGWSAYEGRSPGEIWAGLSSAEDAVTKIQVRAENGSISTVREIHGIAHRLVASPVGDGIYARRLPSPRAGGFMPEKEEVIFVPLAESQEKHVVPVSGTGGWDWGPRFAITQDGSSLVIGEKGGLREIQLADKTERQITFDARVELEVYTPTPPQKVTFPETGSSFSPRVLHTIDISPDGKEIVFGAAGYIWIQRLRGGLAEILHKSDGYSWNGVFSPEGSRLALLETRDGINSVKVIDLKEETTRTLVSGESWPWQLSWSPDGQRLVFVDTDEAQVVVIDARDGTTHWALPINGSVWGARPNFSADGKAVFLTENNALKRIPFEKG